MKLVQDTTCHLLHPFQYLELSTFYQENALRSTSQRIVSLPLQNTLPSRPSYENLEILLKQTIDLSGFDGLVGFYLKDLQNSQEIHFAEQLVVEFPVEPDVAFTAASIIKIPVLVSIYNELDEPPDEETANLIAKMIEESGNEATDWLMQRVIDSYRAPLIVTENMQALGLENTFLASRYFGFVVQKNRLFSVRSLDEILF